MIVKFRDAIMKRIKFDAEPSERVVDGYWVVSGRVDTSNRTFDKLYLGDRVDFDKKAFEVTQLNERHGRFIDVEIQRKRQHLEELSNFRNNVTVQEEECKKKSEKFKTTVALKREEFEKTKKAAEDLYSNPISGMDF